MLIENMQYLIIWIQPKKLAGNFKAIIQCRCKCRICCVLIRLLQGIVDWKKVIML